MIQMKNDTILLLILEQLKDNLKGYDEIHTEYWFGRLADTQDLIRKIIGLTE